MIIRIPKFCLVLLIGAAGSGKSTFAKKYFRTSEVLSSDFYRAMLSDNENDQTVTKEAFSIVHYITRKRLALGKLTVIDATNVQQEARQPLIQLARQFHCPLVAIIFNLPEAVCLERNQKRSNRNVDAHVIQQQHLELNHHLQNLKAEGFQQIFILDTDEKINAVSIERVPL